MTTQVLDFVTFSPTTFDGKINFIGAVVSFFKEFTEGRCNDETKDTYIKRYNEKIFPCIKVNIYAGDYTEESIQMLLAKIKEENDFDDNTIRGDYEHLIYYPLECFHKHHKEIEDPLWGTGFKFENSKEFKKDSNNAILHLKKSLTPKQEIKAMEALASDYKTEKGERIGLMLMLLCGARNNEICALKFRDFIEFNNYPGVYFLQIYKSTSINSNALKAGGKTYNSPRRLPLVPALVEFIKKRMEYIQSVAGEDIDDYPIACRGNNYMIHCSANDLTNAGRCFLRDEIRIQEEEVAGINYLIKNSKGDDDLQEKDATTYLLRRNLATHLYTLGLTLEQSQYYMGHVMENTPSKRSDYTDEDYLYEIYRKLLHHPLNTSVKESINEFNDEPLKLENVTSAHIKINKDDPDEMLYMQIKGKENNDIIELSVDTIIKQKELSVRENLDDLKTTVNITKQVEQAYEKAGLSRLKNQ